MRQATRTITERYLSTTQRLSSPVDRARYERLATHLRRRLGQWLPRPGAKVLDLGCGLGELLYVSHALGCAECVGVNLCQEEIEAARPFVKARFLCADVLDYLRTSRETFDWIGALNILEHLEKEDLLELLSLAAGRLSPGGALVAMVPNAISPFAGVTRHWDFTHEWAFTPNNFRQIAPIGGFSDLVEFRECRPVVHGVRSAVRWVIWQGVRFVIRCYLMVEVADSKGGIYTMDMMVRLRK